MLRSIDGGEGGRRKWLPKLNRERIEQLANVSVDFCQAVVVNPLERTVIIALDGPVHIRGETLDCVVIIKIIIITLSTNPFLIASN